MRSIADIWSALDAGERVTLVLGVLALMLGSGIGVRAWLWWRDRPRLRVALRHVGIMTDDRSLVIEVANYGGRATSLHPVIRVRGRVMRPRKWWYPGELARLLPRGWRDRADRVLQFIRVPIGRGPRPERLEYNIDPGQNLRLEPHAGAREIRASARRPGHALLFFRVYNVRQEGRRRPQRVYTTYSYRRRVSRAGYWWARIRYLMLGIPKAPRRTTIDDWHAER